jgi:predicted RNase H-like HicB family nuclease
LAEQFKFEIVDFPGEITAEDSFLIHAQLLQQEPATINVPRRLIQYMLIELEASFTKASASDTVSFADVSLEPQEEGGFVALSSEYPGAVGQGETEEEALKDLQEAISLLREVLEEGQERT